MLSNFALTYSYTTTSTSSSSSGGGAFFAVFLILALIVAIVAIVALWKIFEKAGEKGWKAIIPIYNSWTLFEIAGKPGWWALIALVPYVGSVVAIVLYIIAALELAKRFGKSTTFAVVGLIIFSLVGLLILGFGDAKYTGTKKTTIPPAAPATPAA